MEIHPSQCKQDDNLQQILKCVCLHSPKSFISSTDYKSRNSLTTLWQDRNQAKVFACLEAEEVYVAQPDGFIDPDHPEKVYRLRKALYGLKQALRAWGTINMGLWYPKDSGFELTAFLDTDHAKCIDTNKSTSGGIQFLGDKLVSWMSKKQDCTAMSLAKAEYVALSASYAQVMWMRTQLKDYGFNYNKIPLYCDSQSAIAISCNPVQHLRTKHIHTRYHFIKEHVENGIIELYFVRTEYQLADIFTKALLKIGFSILSNKLIATQTRTTKENVRFNALIHRVGKEVF
ncbi:retrovirus-related pol polyprotein from transposon TNT 1-94 [Tanacetum coccineum]